MTTTFRSEERCMCGFIRNCPIHGEENAEIVDNLTDSSGEADTTETCETIICPGCNMKFDWPLCGAMSKIEQVKYLTKEEIVVLYEHLKHEYLHHGMIEVMKKISCIANDEQ